MRRGLDLNPERWTTTAPAARWWGPGLGLLALLALLTLLPLGCRDRPSGSQEGNPEGTRPLQVAATLFPLWDIAREVGGDRATVELVLPPGASPHLFEPTPSHIRRLRGCRALFRIGHGLDDWATRLAPGPEILQVVVDQGIKLRRAGDHHGGEDDADASPGRPGGIDPHYWLDPRNGARIAANIAEVLARLDPEGSENYRSNAARYAARLQALHQELRSLAESLPNRRLVTLHDAWGYFGAAYGLEVVATFTPFPGREPSARWIREFQERVRRSGVSAVFIEPQLAGDALRPLAADLGIGIAVLDPIGGVRERASYMDLLRWNMAQIQAASQAARDETSHG